LFAVCAVDEVYPRDLKKLVVDVRGERCVAYDVLRG